MTAISSSQLLAVWERAYDANPAERALLLLEAALPEQSPDEFRQLTIRQRDSLVLSLRETLFGPRFHSKTECPSCRATMELGFDAREIQGTVVDPQPLPQPVRWGSDKITFRLPNTGDLLALSGQSVDPETLQNLLVQRCVLSVRRDDGTIVKAPLPHEAIAAVAREIAEKDSDSNTEFEIKCAECGCAWTALFDVVSFLWAEIDSFCRRVLLQVHYLARAYGWTESEILALSPARRSYYLSLIET